jgi:hypothetical protein
MSRSTRWNRLPVETAFPGTEKWTMEVKPEQKVVVLEERPTTHYCHRHSPYVVSPTAELGCMFHSAARQYHPELLFASRRSYLLRPVFRPRLLPSCCRNFVELVNKKCMTRLNHFETR